MIFKGFSIEITSNIIDSPPQYRPVDYLNELTHVEMGLKHFCYDNNRYVIIRAGTAEVSCELWPDISIVLEDVPGILLALRKDRNTVFSLHEISREFLFSPVDREVTCTYRVWGHKHHVQTSTAPKIVVVQQFVDLLKWILSSAVASDYITRAEAAAYFTDPG